MSGLTLVNPYGTAYLTYLWNALPMPRPYIAEWQPIWASPNLTAFFGISLLAAAYAWVQRGDKPMTGWPAVALFALAAVRHIRHVSIYALVWMAFVPAWFDTTPMGRNLRLVWARRPGLVISGSLAVILAGVGLSVSFEPWSLKVPVDGQDLVGGAPLVYPAGAVQYLRDCRFQGNIMTRDVEGSYVSWHLFPAVKVGLDGRYEVAYKPGVAEETLAFYEGHPGWEQTLARYPTDLVLVGPTDPIGPLLTEQTRWRRVYHDDVFMLFARPGLILPYLDARGKKIEARFP